MVNIDVSVIVPVYNGEKYLKKCLDSLNKQTLETIEIICINDGSTDKSLEILNDYAKKDSRIKVISKENGGSWLCKKCWIGKC
ncbi:glycosyltransferase [Methanobrevibacter arboriphilus]|uniref:glycosyltransferase family 2 protein n=1 Tax=Methanobrevibacter arboriphilus TaxID=39441 RepID=UPI0006D1F5E6|nr:glycosyltransferase [Methanobrevibacter arboriphilus]